MNAYILFISKAILSSGLFYLWYLLVLKNQKMHVFNRHFLRAAVVASLLLPTTNINYNWVTQQQNPVVIKMLQVISGGGVEEVVTAGSQSWFTLEHVLYSFYAIISIALLVWSIIPIIKLFKIKASNRVTKYLGYNLISINIPSAPFSFLNNLYWNESTDPETNPGKQMMVHELCHIKQKHSYDNLLMQLVLVVFWINPFYWLMRKELTMVHEFIADEAAIAPNDTDTFARMLLHARYANLFPTIAHSFFHSPIKRRLTMLTKSPNTSFAGLRRILALPLYLGIATLCSFKITNAPQTRATQHTLIVLDAGHGGKDNGAYNADGLLEKNVAMQLTNNLNRLAKDYNIDVVLTRDGDNYPTLNERVKMANNVHAALFVSIHINSKLPGNDSTNDYEMYVSKQNKQLPQSILLGSAIAGRLGAQGIKPSIKERNLHVLNENNNPAVLIECGEIHNPSQMAMLKDPVKSEQFCRNILSGIVDFINRKDKK